MSRTGCELPVQAEVPEDAEDEDAQEAAQRGEDDEQIRQPQKLDTLGERELGLGERYLLPLVREGAGWVRPFINSLLTLAHHRPHRASASSSVKWEARGLLARDGGIKAWHTGSAL